MTETPPPAGPAHVPADDSELLPLPGGPLLIWPEAVLRGAGFPIQGLVDLGDPSYAEGSVGVEEAEERQNRKLAAIAARTDLQTAVAWQNPSVLRDAVRPLATEPPGRRNQRIRRKERVVARYWARYCGKNDTIGFFGPVCWVELRDGGPFATVEVGTGLVRSRAVHLEPWAVDELAATFSADPAVRAWLAPRLNPANFLYRQQVQRTEGPPVPVSERDWRVLTACDGQRTARDLASSFVAAGDFPDAEAVYRHLDEMVAAGHLRWDLEPPLVMRPLPVVRAAVAAIGDPAVRAPLDDALDRVDAGLSAVATAQGVDALDSALAALDATFTALTAKAPKRREGETYGGRQLVYLDTTRDARISFGPALLDRLGPPLSLMAWSLRSFTAELAARYEEAFLGAYALIRSSGEVDRVWLAHVLGICAQEIFVPGKRVFEPILAAFAKRWDDILGVDRDTTEVRHAAADLWPAVREAFPAAVPGWIQAHLHGADVQIAAADAAAVERGEWLLVLGELHAAWNNIEAGLFVDQHPDPGRLARLVQRSVRAERVALVPVKHYPRVLARTMPAIPDERQWWLALTHYPGGDPDRQVNLAQLMVERTREGMFCRTEDGRARFRVIDVLGMLIGAEVMDAFKELGRGRAHVPRIFVDDLVVLRESWSLALSDVDLPAQTAPESVCFRAVRTLGERLGLPRFVFVKLPGEMKPFYLDLTSSVQAAALVTMLRRARETQDPTDRVRFSEMLPGPDESWLPGPDGERYTSELRLQLVDPGTAWD